MQAPGTLNDTELTVSANGKTVITHPSQGMLQRFLSAFLVLAEDWDDLSASVRQDLIDCPNQQKLLEALVEHRLLTRYQAERIAAGKTFGLVLGNYRILDRLGTGGMGIVFKAEHVRMRRLVAIKVLPLFLSRDQSFRNLKRFYSEVRAVAQLQHPHVVQALDAGEATSPDKDAPVLHYYVMEYVEGKDLEEYVRTRGPLSPARAAEFIHQVAGALAEAHKHNLVHRDIKPSNILITPKEQAKLLDFGLVRHFRHRMTEPGTVLGTVDYIAPEQAHDASMVDIRADIYGLGGTLFWCLTGRPPFEPCGNLAQEMALRQTQPPPSVRSWRAEVPAELDAVLARMMACSPADRYPTPQTVMNALLPFLRQESREQVLAPALTAAEAGAPSSHAATRQHRILVIDDDRGIRDFCKRALQVAGLACDDAANGTQALERVARQPYDLVLVDWAMPGLSGPEVCRRLRENPPTPHFKIILMSGHATSDDLAGELHAGIDDYLTKPFSITQLTGRIKAALRLKDAQGRSDLLNRRLLAVNHELEQNLNARDSDLVHARNALVLALAKLVGYRDAETGAHLVRLQRYGRRLAEEAASLPSFAGQIDTNFIQTLECCAPLHDIGKVGLPDHILLKDGRLDLDERIVMQTHTTIGADTLKEVAKQHGSAVAFLQMAIDIARHHHERYDGGGYPDRLAGDDIPLAARIVTIGDVYDALRTRRVYKPALSHSAALQLMMQASHGHFDPALMHALERCAPDFDRIFRDLPD